MRPKLKLLCASLLLLTGCRFGHHAASNSRRDIDEIKAAYSAWQHAFATRDLNGIMAIYAPDVVAYDLVPPLQFVGADAYRKDYETFLSQFKGPVKSTIPNIHIDQTGDTAFAFGLERIRGTLADGTAVDLWVRFTDGWKRKDGHWVVAHEHVSVPVDVATGKARLDLTP
jgi:ketosteroid isomerase-like protein